MTDLTEGSQNRTYVRMVTTYKLTMTPPDGPTTVRTGLTRDEAMWALTDLMYGTFDDEQAERLATGDERVAALAA